MIDSKNLIAIVRISIEELIEYNAQIDQWFPVERTKLYAPPRKDDVSQVRLDLTAEKELTKETNDTSDKHTEGHKKAEVDYSTDKIYDFNIPEREQESMK